MEQVQVVFRQAAVGKEQGDDRRPHQQQSARRLAVDELLERGEHTVEGALPGGIEDAPA